MSKTKIIELEFLGPPAIGGVEIYVGELCKRFNKKGFDTEIWSTDLLDFNGGRDKNLKSHFFGSTVIKFKSYILPFPPRILCPGMIVQFLKFKRSDTILHTHSLSFHTFLGLLFYKKFRKVYVVLQVDADDLLEFLKTMKGRVVFFVLKYFSKKEGVKFVGVTERETKIYKKIGMGNVMTVPNGVNVAEFDNIKEDDVEETKRRFKIKNTFNILYGGRIHKNKGLDILIRSFKKFTNDNFRLIIAGVDCGFSDYLQKLAKELGIEKRVIFTGKLPREKYIVFFKCCDLFVLPSVSGESFGMVLAEAMACKKPVIGTNFGGIPQVIRNNSGLLFKKGSVSDLFKKIQYIYKNKKIASKMGANGRELAEKEYDWDQIVSNYEKDFERSI